MNMSKKEKYLLGILGTVLISVVYYQFIYTNQVEKLDAKKKEKAEIEARYNSVIESIKTLDTRKENVKILNSSILDKSAYFYPTILQEKIILEIDKLLADSGLKGNIAFNPVEVAQVETLAVPKIEKSESSIKVIADEYNNVYKSEEKTKEETANKSTAEKSGEAVGEQSGIVTAEQLKVAINFTGSYDTLKKFILSVEQYNRKIVITNVAITPKSESQVTGTMNLEFYAIPKLGDDDSAYLKWTMENVYGKDVLFSAGAASGAYNSTVEEQGTNVNVDDFVMMLRPTSSELPVLTIGKAKDSARETYLYSDNSKVEEVEIEFNEENDKMYYKYKTTKDFYPKASTGSGKEFTCISKDIVMDITSEARASTNDNSTVKLKVINNTKKNVNIVIKSDDGSNPRISVMSEGNTVNVTKK